MTTNQVLQDSKAWQLMNQNQPESALMVWNDLIGNAKGEERDNFESNSCYALIALNRENEAREIYMRLFAKSYNHRYAHQLCMVERKVGNFEKAIEWLEVEEKLISSNDTLALAANIYEYGKVNELIGNRSEAERYAEVCIELSMRQNDLIMLACANRLMGDVIRHSNVEKAVVYYAQAQKCFFDAGDLVGVDEIDDLIAQLEKA